jgi:hypothetical protein
MTYKSLGRERRSSRAGNLNSRKHKDNVSVIDRNVRDVVIFSFCEILINEDEFLPLYTTQTFQNIWNTRTGVMRNVA